MTTQIQRRRGTTAQHSTFTGAVGEVTVDTDKEVLVVHDGAQVGGYPQMRENGSNSALALGSAGIPSLKFAGDTNTGIYSPGADQVAISTGGSGRLFVDASGNVSVGTTATSGFGRGVSVDGTTFSYYDLYADGTILGRVRSGLGQMNVLAQGASTDLILGTQNTERLRITSAGLVGVGTSNPQALLEVNGEARFTRPGVASQYVGIIGDGADTRIIAEGSSKNLTIKNNSTISSAIIFDQAVASSYIFNQAGSERLRITSAGLVGIGISAPSAKLECHDSVSAQTSTVTLLNNSYNNYTANGTTAYPVIRLQRQGLSGTTFPSQADLAIARYEDAGSNARTRLDFRLAHVGSTGAPDTTVMSLLSSGNVGIGTTSPGAKLEVGGGSGYTVSARLQANPADPGYYTDLTHTAQEGLNVQVTDFGYPTTQLRLRRGFVGVNTSTPAAGLDVLGITGIGDPFRVRNSSSEFLRVDASGRLLVGTSSARSNFFNSTVTAGLQLEGTADNQGRSISVVSSSATASHGGQLFLAHQKSGAVGGNTTLADGDRIGLVSFQGSDGTNFIEGARVSAEVDGGVSTGDLPSRLVFSTCPDSGSSPVERMRIDNVGRSFFGTAGLIPGFYPAQVVISATNATEGLDIHGTNSTGTNLSIWAAYAGGGTLAMFWAGTPRSAIGAITHNGTSVSYNTSSDYRLKENVTPVTDGIARLQQLKPSRFNFIANPSKTVDGFLAHEVQAIVPEAITGEKDAVDDEGNPQYQGIDQSKMVPLLTAALQEAVAKIESLEARLTAAGI